MTRKLVHSYSSISTWEQCPRKFEEQYIHRRFRDRSDQITHGETVHKEIEEFLLGQRETRPRLEPKDGLLDLLKGLGAGAERDYAVTASLEPTGFWDGNARLRGKLDATLVQENEVFAWDWKTGKKRSNDLQADVYYTLLSAAYPGKSVTIVFDYLDKGRQPPIRPDRTATMRVTSLMEHIERSKVFPPRPTPLCGWCSVTTCEYNKKGK